jgi:hypothetical protein
MGPDERVDFEAQESCSKSSKRVTHSRLPNDWLFDPPRADNPGCVAAGEERERLRNLIDRAFSSAGAKRHNPACSQLRSGRLEGSPAHRGDDTELKPHPTMNDVNHDVLQPIIRDLDGWTGSVHRADANASAR